MKPAPTIAPLLAATLSLVSVLGAVSCGSEPQAEPSIEERADRPPQFRQVTQNLDCTIPIIPERELVIRDLGVVNDPLRTQWSGVPNPADPRDGAWSFGRLMANMAGPVPPEDFVRNWLAHWETPQVVNGLNIPPRNAIQPVLINPWPKRPDGKLDLKQAPLRLLAIVNRMDLRDLSLGSAGEGRFVFGVLNGAGNPTQFVIILEYNLPAQTQADVDLWAQRWHNLGQFAPGSPQFNDALQAITDGFAGANVAPGKPNGSAINQIRTNEIELSFPWELREFRINPANGQLRQETVNQTPDSALRTSVAFSSFVNENEALLMSGGFPLVPLVRNGAPFRGGSSLADFGLAWTNPAIINNEARHRFALNTCNGCHLNETGTTFLHIGNRGPSQMAPLSGFMTGTTATDPMGLTHSFNEFTRRSADLSNILCAIGGGGDAGTPPTDGGTPPTDGGSGTQPPSIVLTSPVQGSVHRGGILVSANATDDLGISEVRFFDGSIVIGSDLTAPFEFVWNTAGLPDGSHTLRAEAKDVEGFVTLSAPVTLTVDNTLPIVSLTSPVPNGRVRGIATLAANASDNLAVSAVDFIVDGVLLGTDTAAPFAFAWNTPPVPTGPHSVQARVIDFAGNQSFSPIFTVVVDNVVPSTNLIAPAPGSVVSGTVLVQASAGDNDVLSRVEFLAGTQLIGSDTTAPFEVSWNTLNSGNGPVVLTSRAVDLAGNVTTSAGFQVTVSNSGMASFNPNLRVPVCATVDSVCDTGNLVVGRAQLGPEANAPNTLQGTCVDNTSGTFHVDESVDRIRVKRVDGTPFGAGKAVQIEVDVWAFSGFSSDQLDLFFAADANAPVWQHLTTLTPTKSGANTLTATHVLPVGGLQAVRAQFRWGGSASPCVSGSFNDRDDLAFAVGPAEPDAVPPTVSFTAPTGSGLVGINATLAVNASDNLGVTRVEFFDGATLIGTDTTAPFSLAWNTSGVPAGAHMLTAKAFDFAGNSQQAQLTVTVDNAPPTVFLTSPVPNAQVSGVVTLAANASDSASGISRVDFFRDGILVGSDTTAPFSVAWNSAGLEGTRTLTARAFDGAGNNTLSAPVTVQVVVPTLVVNNAVVDPVLMAPTCGQLGLGCDTGPSMVLGRAALGPETNAPNTLQASCVDSTNGAFHTDESLDAIRLVTVDGTALAPGKTVKVEVTVWAWGGFSEDKLDLFIAPDATAASPAWTLLTTLTPTAAGANVLSHTFTLPPSAAGGLQVLRGQFRWGGGGSPCDAGGFSDRDDLVFRVQ